MINKLNLEKIVLTVLSLTFFIGIWHAFPMVTVVSDEVYYVVGVLHAMDAHSIFPQANDIPYGTMLYILDYVVTAIVLSIFIPFFHSNSFLPVKPVFCTAALF